MLDPEGRVASWNEGALKIKGYTADEILGRSFETFYPADVVASGFPRHELEVAARDGRFEDEEWRVRKDGSLFWANVVLTAIRDAGGSLVGYAKVTRDLTLRREAEQRSRELAAEKAAHATAAKKNAELEDLNHRLEQALADAERARAAAEEAYRQLGERETEFRTLANAIRSSPGWPTATLGGTGSTSAGTIHGPSAGPVPRPGVAAGLASRSSCSGARRPAGGIQGWP